jgi:hypothetical protein
MTSLSATEAAKAPSDAVVGTLGCQSSLAPSRLCFTLGSAELRATFTHAWSQRLAAAAFSPLLKQGAAMRVYEGGIFASRTSLTVTFDRAQVEVPIVDNDDFGAAYIAVREVFARFAAAAANNLAFYGATCARNDRALVCIGPPGSGKTVLALHLANAGLQFCGDEIFVLTSQGCVAAVQRLPALRESCLPMLPAAQRAAVLAAPGVISRPYGRLWYALEARDLCGIAPEPAPRTLGAIVMLEGRADEPRIAPIATDTLLAALMQRAFIRSSQLRDLAGVARAVRTARGFSLVAGTPEATATLLAKTLAACE